jgi:hypothetical protein
MNIKLLVLLLVIGLIGFEWYRQTHPTSVRIRETYEFDTPAGPRTATTVVDVEQSASIPYLPGGDVGRMRTSGDAATADLGGVHVFMPRGDRWLYEMATIYGTIEPRFETADITPSVSNSPLFLKRLNQKRATLSLDLQALRPDLKKLVGLVEATDLADPSRFKPANLETFAAEHPGLKLRRVTFSVTDKPVSRHLDAMLPWIDDPKAVIRDGPFNYDYVLRDFKYSKDGSKRSAAR